MNKQLVDLIKGRIDQDPLKSISFATFMELALYHEQFGYYQTASIGKTGDFTTASVLSPLYAQCFAHQLIQIFPHLNSTNILEIGAGSGHFALYLLSALADYNQLPDRYYIYEKSKGMRIQQQLLLKKHAEKIFSRIIWLEEIPSHYIGSIIANEVLDALPVHCFKIEDEILERRVSYHQDQFTWQASPILNTELANTIERLRNDYYLPFGYQSEINLSMPAFINKLTQLIEKGIIFFADYGYGQREYYHPERNQGTLTTFYKHQKNNNPLIHVGQQDISAHVDFTAVIENASTCGCDLLGFTTQSAFLFTNNLMQFASKLESTLSIDEIIRLHQVIKILTMPTEMGDCVKIMALGKNIELPLYKNWTLDRRRDL